MSRTRKLLIGLAVVAVIVASGVYLLLSNLDRIVAAAIEKYGAQATGTKVEVSSVRIALRSGEGSVGNLRVGNPVGFTSPDSFRLENITAVLNTDSVTKDPIVIDKVLVKAPRVTYEINRSGQANIDIIRKKLETSQPKDGPRTKEAGDMGKKKIVIRSLIIEGGEASIQVAALPDQSRTVAIPRIELSNLGGKGGDSPGAIARQIAGPLLNEAARAAYRAGVGQYLGKEADEVRKALEGKAVETLGEPGKDAARGAEGALKKLFGK